MNFVRRIVAARKRWATVALATLGAIIVSEGARADGTAAGAISGMMINQQIGSMVFIASLGTYTGGPSCATNTTYRFVLNLSSAEAAQMFTMLLAARVAGTAVTLIGAGTCNTYAGVEDLIYIVF
jgi:hypothetical protein